MGYELITAALKAALEAIGDIVRIYGTQLTRIIYQPDKAHPSVGQLIETLRGEPSLAIFDGRIQVLTHGIRWEIRDLAQWLIGRGLEAGAGRAVADLQLYIRVTQIPFAMVLGLSGLEVEKAYRFCGGIDLLPWDRLPGSYKKHIGYKALGSSFELKWPSAALVRKLMLPKIHVSDREMRPLLPFDDSELRDLVLCIGVVGPFAPEVLISWLEPPPWVPEIGVVSCRPFLEGRLRHDLLTDDHFVSASSLFEIFRGLSTNRKAALRLPMQRLGIAMRGSSNVDSAMDLGIALEALFLSDLKDDRGELSFRLRLRAARYLGHDLERRNKLFRIMKNLYDLRSKAVHAGRVPDNIGGKPTPEVLLEGYQLAAEAIRRFILEGVPNWNEIQLQ